jgi:proteasome activator subunit 4
MLFFLTCPITSSRAVIKILTFIKIRTYAKSGDELWLDEWHNPLERHLTISVPSAFLESLGRPLQSGATSVSVYLILFASRR